MQHDFHEEELTMQIQICRFTLITDLLYILLFALIFGSAYLYFDRNYQIVTLPPPIYDDPTLTQQDQPESIFEQFNFPEFREHSSPPPRLRPKPPEHVAAMLDSIYEQYDTTHTYDPAYVKISYPGGDVAPEVGVCTCLLYTSPSPRDS